MGDNFHGFLEWQEQFVSQEKGNRVVHYYLKDTSGDSILAVVGTERSVRHMIYVVSDEFLQAYGSENSISANFKWRSKREVVDWLTSLLSKQYLPQSYSKSLKADSIQASRSPEFSIHGLISPGTHQRYPMSRFARRLKGHNSDIVWSGDAWVCGKQLRHFPAFCRNKVTIAIHSFVFVMAKEEKQHLAYLEDLYEDRKGHKKVKVRWFHDNREVEGLIPLPNQHQREVFITPYVQVISAESVDSPATVLTPDHHERCLALLPDMYSDRVHICFRQFRNNMIKPFDLTKLQGYFKQTILSRLAEQEEVSQGGIIKQGVKRSRSCRGRQRFVTSHSDVKLSGQGPAYQNMSFGSLDRRPMTLKYVGPMTWLPQTHKVGEKIELLCQDSGIRGCWFRCTILQVSQKRLKVQYDDLQNEDGCGNLEECVPALRVATPDKLGMRSSSRLTVRPCRSTEDQTDCVLEIGLPVDAWWNDGWWEGVVTEIDSWKDHGVQVYFPGENRFSTFQRSELRKSRDWVGNQWVDIEPNPDIVSVISRAVSPGPKPSNTIGAHSDGSALLRREDPPTYKLDTVVEDMQESEDGVEPGNLTESFRWLTSDRRPLIEDGEEDDHPDHDMVHEEDKASDSSDNDDEEDEDGTDMIENIDTLDQETEAVELVEVTVL